MTPIIKGKAPKAKFCIISISPKAVPSSLGFTIIGKVGIMTEQKRPIEMPMRVTGIHLNHSSYLRYRLVQHMSIERQVKRQKSELIIMRQLFLCTLSIIRLNIGTKRAPKTQGTMRQMPAYQGESTPTNTVAQYLLPLSRKGIKRDSCSVAIRISSQQVGGSFNISLKLICQPCY